MTAPTNLRGIALANAILAGDLPLADYPLFTARDWHWAAQGAIDANDYAELLAMRDEQDEHDREETRERSLAYALERNRNAVIDAALTRKDWNYDYR